MATPQSQRVVEIVGDGIAETGKMSVAPTKPESGVVTLLVFRLCDCPEGMFVHRRPIFRQKRYPLWRRVQQTKMRAADYGDAGLIYVVDSEGEDPAKYLTELVRGRDAKRKDFPMAVGVAHPCIEAWLLADPQAIRKAFDLKKAPSIPSAREYLPNAPKTFPGKFYKRFLAECAQKQRADLSMQEKSALVLAINDIAVIENSCPSFASFAAEVKDHIGPIFKDKD